VYKRQSFDSLRRTLDLTCTLLHRVSLERGIASIMPFVRGRCYHRWA
jgi:hypothetical protein